MHEKNSLFLLLIVLQSHCINGQSFLDGILGIFRPMADTTRTHIREELSLARPMVSSQRDTAVLGAPPRSPLSDVPVCSGGSKLCSFIACQADNFKNDQSFANLKLAADVLGDKKLRQSVGNNPEAINAVCIDQGVDAERCQMFTKGFQFINRFITSIEKPIDEMKAAIPPQTAIDNEGAQIGEVIPSQVHVVRDESIPPSPGRIIPQTLNDDFTWSSSIRRSQQSSPTFSMDGEAIRPSLNQHGSHTWSSNPERVFPVMDDSFHRADWISSLTPPPIQPFTVLPPPAPPLAFPTVQSVFAPTMAPLPNIFDPFRTTTINPFNKLFFSPIKIEPILRSKRDIENALHNAIIRVKRGDDYYDQVDVADSPRVRGERRRGGETAADEYYDETDTTRKNRMKSRGRPNQKNCLELLG